MDVDMLLGGLVGLLVGVLATVLFFKFREDDADSIKALKDEHEAFRKQVDDHFVNTATLFKGLTKQYKDVYQHIAQGAGELCTDEAKQLKIDLDQTELLTQAPKDVEAAGEEEVVEEVNEVDHKTTETSSTTENKEVPSADEATDDVPLASEAEVPPELAAEVKKTNEKTDA